MQMYLLDAKGTRRRTISRGVQWQKGVCYAGGRLD
jgi:hypothetical protein